MATEALFRDDAYLRDCTARVVDLTPEGGIVLDRTVFYAQGGGQPGDVGHLARADGTEMPVHNTAYAPDRTTIVHLPIPGAPLPRQGEPVTAVLDWERRFSRMKVHTALHLLSVILPYPVTGGSIGDGDGRLDFDIPEAGLDKAEVEGSLNALIARDAAVADRWISNAELDANPGLVKTMSVKRPAAPAGCASSRSRASISSPAAAPTCGEPARSGGSR